MQCAEPTSSPLRLDSASLPGEIRLYMERHRAAVASLIEAGGEDAGHRASQEWARIHDGLLCSMFCALRAQVGDEALWRDLALGAVGSYGRRDLGFRSDIDIRILCKSPAKAGRIAEALLYPLWDAGLQIGHQVLTVKDSLKLAEEDLATATTLLDWRHLAGSNAVSEKLQEKALAGLFSGGRVHAFLQQLDQQARERWQRFGDSVYLLEPDVKSGQGGLRDQDICHWTAVARWHVSGLDGLVESGVMLPAEHRALAEASAFLRRIRNVLHVKSLRRTERLGFEAQEIVAEVMGYGSGGAGCEALMSEYYRHARVIANAREMLMVRAAPPPKKKPKEQSLGGGVRLIGDAVGLESLEALAEQPVLALRAYWYAVHNDLPVARGTRDAIMRATSDPDFCARLRASEEAARLFRRLIRQPRRVVFKDDSLLREFHDVGLLVAMIPEFSPVVGRVHHDIYHVYTVDAHSIAAVDRLRHFARGDLGQEFPGATQLAADIARPQCLYMALLLHDIGKDVGGRAHSERGYEMVRPILERLGVQEHDIVEIQHLVLKHLRMYHVASRRDIDDPKTIESFRDEVHGPEGLKELYLLTLCDVSTTSPTALTGWKRRMLRELYERTTESFDGMPAHSEARAEAVREGARRLCPDPGEADFMEHFLRVVPERYLYANEPAQIVKHSRLARQSESQRNVVSVINTAAPYVELACIVDDKPGALALVTAAMAANRMKVVSAQLYSWEDTLGRRRTLDTFWVRSGNDTASIVRSIKRLEADLERLVSGELTPDELLDQRRGSKLSERPAPQVETSIHFDNRAATNHTVVEVMAEDRLGLLYLLARAIKGAGLQISLAKINTEGNAVADVFYVTDNAGKMVTDRGQLEGLEQRLRDAVMKAELFGSQNPPAG
jgi:[protein-PII] uridylyltransferase